MFFHKRRFKLALLFLSTLVLLIGFALSRHFYDRGSASPNVILITLDTLRADHLGCYGYRLNTTPNIDDLAKRGVRFADCTVQWPKTRASMASLLTGTYPLTNGVTRNRGSIPGALPVLGEAFQRAGYRTCAVVANFNVGKKFGFGRGFDSFYETWQERWKEESGNRPFKNRPGKVKRYTNASLVIEKALSWLSEPPQSKRPFFMWLHFIDPHGPYTPPEAFGNYFVGDHPVEPISAASIPGYQRQKDPASGEVICDLGFYRVQYDREIRYLDAELGRLFEWLGNSPHAGNNLMVLSADHGESLGEHNYFLGHGKLPYQPCAHIPLIIAYPGFLPGGIARHSPVGLIDLSSTILEMAGIKIPDTFEGESLVELIRGNDLETGPGYVFMESGRDRNLPQQTVRHGGWKLIRVLSREDKVLMKGEGLELYDISNDPKEGYNLAHKNPEVVKKLNQALSKWNFSHQHLKKTNRDIREEKLAPEEIEMLRSLGYVE